MAQSKHNTQKKLIKTGDVVKFTDIYVVGPINKPNSLLDKNCHYAIVLDEKYINKDKACLIMTSNGSKEWVRKERIEKIISLKER